MSSFDPSFWLAVLFFSLVHFIMVWDFLSVYSVIPYHSVSWYVQGWAAQSAILPLVVGVVIGHLFFGRGA